MACNCGNSGFNSSCSSCSKVADIDTETPLNTIKNGDENFCFNEVTDEICENLQNDKGIHPYGDSNHTDCDDLHALNQYLNGDLWNKLKTLNICNINDLKCWLYELVSNSYNFGKALVCAICGLWSRIHTIEDSINKLWAKMAKVEAAIDSLSAQNWEIDTQYTIPYSTPDMAVSIDRSTGDFYFTWSDWLDSSFTTKLGVGTLTGTVNYGMGVSEGSTAKWQIRDVYIGNVSYKTNNVSGDQTFAIHAYVKNKNESEVYNRTHNTLSNFSDTVNKTITIGQSGTLAAQTSTDWIQFLEVFNEVVGGTLNDDANVQIKFTNNNKTSVPQYV